MTLILNRNQAREFDRLAQVELSVPGIVLMENAGRGATDILDRLGIGGPVVVCCGKGNNAGDGLVMARHLRLRGHAVRVALFFDPHQMSGDAGVNFQIVSKCGIACERIDLPQDRDRMTDLFSRAAWLVDALLGTGARGEVQSPLDVVIAAMNVSGTPIFAVDLPSGLDCDTGQAAQQTVRAAHTCTFVAAKPGLMVPSAAPYVGRLHIADIGVPVAAISAVTDETRSIER